MSVEAEPISGGAATPFEPFDAEPHRNCDPTLRAGVYAVLHFVATPSPNLRRNALIIIQL